MTLDIDRPIVYLITPGDAHPENFTTKKASILGSICQAAKLAVTLIQIREKLLTVDQLFELSKAAVAIVKDTETRLLINDRADIAVASGADGVHLRSDSIPARVIRGSFPAGFLIGVSTHTPEEIECAKTGGADFAAFGPVFATEGKSQSLGLEKLRLASADAAPFPVLALGGIDATNAESAIATGAGGIAAIRFLSEPENIRWAMGLKRIK